MSSDEGLAAFLAARLDEDEALIRRNSDGHGLADGFPDYRTYVDGNTRAADDYIEHFGPVRMARRVEAKRKILAEHKAVTKLATLTEQELGFLGWYREWVLKNLASAYSDHPDYRQGWKP
jgi:hypothetical protein